jgi:hypothetical protein
VLTEKYFASKVAKRHAAIAALWQDILAAKYIAILVAIHQNVK